MQKKWNIAIIDILLSSGIRVSELVNLDRSAVDLNSRTCMPIEQVQVLLGHTKIDTTLRYANVQQSNVRHSHQKYVC